MTTNFEDFLDNFTIETTIFHIGCIDNLEINNSEFIENISNVIRQMENDGTPIATIREEFIIPITTIATIQEEFTIADEIIHDIFRDFIPNIQPILLKKSKKEIIKKMGPYKRVTKNDKLLKKECSVCLENFKEKQGKRTLPCNHTFHKRCIDKWVFKGTETCPICRGTPFK